VRRWPLGAGVALGVTAGAGIAACELLVPDRVEVDPGWDAAETGLDRDADAEAGFDGDAGAEAGPCLSPNVMCGDACVDLTTDPKHCGACDHDCLGAACAASLCAPATIDPSAVPFYALACDGTTLYYTRQGEVCAAPTTGAALDGGDPCAKLLSIPGTANLALDGPDLYVAGVHDIWHVRVDGGAGLGLDHDPSTTFPGVAAHGGAAFYPTQSGEVRSVGPAGGGHLVIADAGTALAGGIAADDAYVYFFSYDTGGPLVVPRSGGPVVTPGALTPRVGSAVVADGYLYFADADGPIKRLALVDGGGFEILVLAGGKYPRSLVVAPPYLYWLAKGDDLTANGRLYRRSLATPDAIVLAVDLDNPTGLAVDASYAYFVATGYATGAGGLYRVAR
jgi:hypothetical protein